MTDISEFTETKPILLSATTWQRFRRYSGIGYLVAVGYMDPGNWATDIEAGSRFGYALLWVILLANLVAMLLQSLCVRLGVASGKDLAQLCREKFNPKVNFLLWGFAEIAIIACDFAEVLGSALALKLLLGLPLQIGILLTAFDTVIILYLQGRKLVKVETIILILISIIAVIFALELVMSQPIWLDVVKGLIPHPNLFKDTSVWFLAIGIFGATVMPHNLYLHSSGVRSRKLIPGVAAKSDAIKLLTADTILTLAVAFLVNAAILILAGSVFHFSGHTDVEDIDDAYYLLAPLLGASVASIIFALALLAAGQSSTITGTIAGQVIFEGFLKVKLAPWQQRLITRMLAIIPAWIGIELLGEAGLGQLLVLSQVILSMQLPFAVIPLIIFVSNKNIVGQWQISRITQIISWLICVAIVAANSYLIVKML